MEASAHVRTKRATRSSARRLSVARLARQLRRLSSHRLDSLRERPVGLDRVLARQSDGHASVAGRALALVLRHPSSVLVVSLLRPCCVRLPSFFRPYPHSAIAGGMHQPDGAVDPLFAHRPPLQGYPTGMNVTEKDPWVLSTTPAGVPNWHERYPKRPKGPIDHPCKGYRQAAGRPTPGARGLQAVRGCPPPIRGPSPVPPKSTSLYLNHTARLVRKPCGTIVASVEPNMIRAQTESHMSSNALPERTSVSILAMELLAQNVGPHRPFRYSAKPSCANRNDA